MASSPSRQGKSPIALPFKIRNHVPLFLSVVHHRRSVVLRERGDVVSRQGRGGKENIDGVSSVFPSDVKERSLASGQLANHRHAQPGHGPATQSVGGVVRFKEFRAVGGGNVAGPASDTDQRGVRPLGDSFPAVPVFGKVFHRRGDGDLSARLGVQSVSEQVPRDHRNPFGRPLHRGKDVF